MASSASEGDSDRCWRWRRKRRRRRRRWLKARDKKWYIPILYKSDSRAFRRAKLCAKPHFEYKKIIVIHFGPALHSENGQGGELFVWESDHAKRTGRLLIPPSPRARGKAEIWAVKKIFFHSGYYDRIRREGGDGHNKFRTAQQHTADKNILFWAAPRRSIFDTWIIVCFRPAAAAEAATTILVRQNRTSSCTCVQAYVRAYEQAPPRAAEFGRQYEWAVCSSVDKGEKKRCGIDPSVKVAMD